MFCIIILHILQRPNSIILFYYSLKILEQDHFLVDFLVGQCFAQFQDINTGFFAYTPPKIDNIHRAIWFVFHAFETRLIYGLLPM